MNKYAVVTGAASGIGKAVTIRLAKKGILVFALDKQKDDIPVLSNVIPIFCDVANTEDIKKGITYILSYTNIIDYLILSAGILCCGKRQLIEHLDKGEWNGVLQTNLTGVMLMMQNFIPLIKNSKSGSIITYSSDQVCKPIQKSAPYLVSKAGVEALTRLAAVELKESKIRVNCIRAAAVDTNFLNSLVPEKNERIKMVESMNEKMPFGMIFPDDIAELTEFLLSDSAAKITGQIITLDSGILL